MYLSYRKKFEISMSITKSTCKKLLSIKSYSKIITNSNIIVLHSTRNKYKLLYSLFRVLFKLGYYVNISLLLFAVKIS